MTWTRSAPSPMFPRRNRHGERERPRRPTVTRVRSPGLNAAVLLLALVTLMATWGGVVEASNCKVEHCTRQFQQAAMASGIRRGPSPAFCVILRQYSDCLRSTARQCRGYLAYHSTITLVQNWNNEFNCSYVSTNGPSVAPPPPPMKDHDRRKNHEHRHQQQQQQQQQHQQQDESSERTVTSPAERASSLEPTARVYSRPERPPLNALPITGTPAGGGIGGGTACNYQGRPEVTHCSFFGDPHLVTFNGEFQTCKVAGAWPLIDNAYLAVSVTNEAVVPGSSATATTKITIIIKGGSDCAPERTYEATVDSVPASFVDGSQWGGPLPPGMSSGIAPAALEHLVPVRIVEKEPGRHVEIHARHLGATLVVRQIGRYLSFSARLPRDIAEQGAAREGLQLCVKGCPASERIDISGLLLGNGHARHPSMPSSGRFHRSQTSESSASLAKGMHRDAALALCREYNLTDYYLDSCMFDLMTTGDPSFSLAASKAQSDYVAMLPDGAQRLGNRSWPLHALAPLSNVSPRSWSSSSASGPGRPSVSLAAILVLVVALLSRRFAH